MPEDFDETSSKTFNNALGNILSQFFNVWWIQAKYPTKGSKVGDMHWVKSGSSFLIMVWFSRFGKKNEIDINHIFVSNTVWSLHSSLELGTCYTGSYFFIIIDNTINKSPSEKL